MYLRFKYMYKSYLIVTIATVMKIIKSILSHSTYSASNSFCMI